MAFDFSEPVAEHLEFEPHFFNLMPLPPDSSGHAFGPSRRPLRIAKRELQSGDESQSTS